MKCRSYGVAIALAAQIHQKLITLSQKENIYMVFCVSRTCLEAGSPCVRKLLYLVDLGNMDDIQRMAAVCWLILSTQDSQGTECPAFDMLAGSTH